MASTDSGSQTSARLPKTNPETTAVAIATIPA
jgi:hypothetical protein